MKNFYSIAILLVFATCKNKTEQTKRANVPLTKEETEIKLPISKNFELYSYFNHQDIEYFAYKIDNWVYLIDLAKQSLIDSINIVFDDRQVDKYGVVSSFCFNGKDSLFLLLNKAIIFVNNKHLEKIIPINELDTVQYKTYRFANLENSPIYYDNEKNEIIGQVYCSVCYQNDKSFYEKKIIGGISLVTGKIKLFNITYPEMYIKNYYGFANHVYSYNEDSLTVVSLPCDPKIYLLYRHTNTKDFIWAKSRFQQRFAEPLDTALAKSREEKMKHMVTVPYYTEVRFDKFNRFFYRFYLKELDLKNMQGEYNTFNNKQLVLMVLNPKNEVAGEYELDKYYNDFISFVGKKGLYINYFSKDPNDSNKKTFKIITLK